VLTLVSKSTVCDAAETVRIAELLAMTAKSETPFHHNFFASRT
jgi:hypothetical protein